MSCSTSCGASVGGDGYDLHLIVGDIRHGIDRKRKHRIDSSRKQKEGSQSDEKFLCDRKADDGLKHGIRSIYCFYIIIFDKDSRGGVPLYEKRSEVSNLLDERSVTKCERSAGVPAIAA